MINKDDLLNDKEFYKSFKSGEDLTTFFKQMHKRAVEHMLNAELDAHLDNEKHQKWFKEIIEMAMEPRR
jgi:putative transposase